MGNKDRRDCEIRKAAYRYRVWLTTQFTANQGPDVYTGIIYDITADYEAGYLHNFKDLYDQESPMIQARHGRKLFRIPFWRECI